VYDISVITPLRWDYVVHHPPRVGTYMGSLMMQGVIIGALRTNVMAIMIRGRDHV